MSINGGKCPFCNGELKQGIVEAMTVWSLLNTNTLVRFLEKEDENKIIKKSAIKLNIRGDGYYCEECMKVVAVFKEKY